MSDDGRLEGLIRTVPSCVYIRILKNLKKNCRLCQFQQFDLLHLNGLNDDEKYDRCKGCCVPELIEKLQQQFLRSYKLEEQPEDGEKHPGLAYL